MPNRDGLGPQAQGPMTGRGFGPCGNGRGSGRGAGFRNGLCRAFRIFASPTKSQVKEDLDQYKKNLEDELEKVNAEQKRLEEEKTN